MGSGSSLDALDTASSTLEDKDVADVLDLLFVGRIEELVPPEDLGEFHDFIREKGIRRRRLAASFRLDCGCLAWIGYALVNVITHEDGIEFTAKPTESFIPDHDAAVRHPEGPTEDPPQEFSDWPIWPFEIYQDEVDDFERTSAPDEHVGEIAEDLGMGERGDLASIREVAAHEDSEATDGPGV